MPTHALDYEIQKYLPLLGNQEKRTLLSVIKSFLSLKNENTEIVNLEQYNKDIDEAMSRIDNGEFTTQGEVEKEMESW